VFRFAAPVPVTIKGFEADLAFDVTRNFNLTATVAFADSKVTGGRAACTDLDNNDEQDTGIIDPVAYYAQVGDNQVDTCSISGRSASVQPRWSGTVQAEYSHPVGFGDAFLRGFMTWKGDSGGDALNPNDSVPAYTLVDLFAGIRASNGAWELSGFVKNLFNTKRVLTRDAAPVTTNANVVGVVGTQSLTYNYMNITTIEPREVGISLRYAFGSR
jgi:iron complex outermembrane receptor protein